MTVLNTAVANQLIKFKALVDARIDKGEGRNEAFTTELKNALNNSKNILFEGNNYSDEWAAEAEKRGLSNIKNTPESLKAYISKQAEETFVNNGIFTKEELHARYEIMLDEYVKKIQIEGRVMADMVHTYIIPPAIEYLTELATSVSSIKAAGLKAGKTQTDLINVISEHLDKAKDATDKMVEARKKANKLDNSEAMAIAYHKNVKESFDVIRYHVDKLELLVNDKLWQLPKYRELLFIK
jgi:glutamine synthetase